MLLFVYMTIICIIAFALVLPQFQANRNHGAKLWIIGMLTFALALIPIQCGDFAYYAKIFIFAKHGVHFEDFYWWLYDFVNENYLVWRACVWGASTVLLFWMVKRLPVNPYLAGFIFVICEFFYFGTMRNMLGFVVMFVSFSILFYPLRKQRILSYILGLLGIYASLYLHRSMYLYVLVLAATFLPFGKKSIRLSLFLIPVLYAMVFILADWMLANFGNEEFQNQGAAYVSGNRIKFTLMQQLNRLIVLCSYVYLLSIGIKYVYFQKNKVPKFFKYLLKYAFILIYAGALFWNQKAGEWLFVRFTGAGEFALMLFMMYFLYQVPRTRGIKLALGALIYNDIYAFLYTWYGYDKFIERLSSMAM